MSIIIIQEKKYNVINKDSFVLFKNKAVFWLEYQWDGLCSMGRMLFSRPGQRSLKIEMNVVLFQGEYGEYQVCSVP